MVLESLVMQAKAAKGALEVLTVGGGILKGYLDASNIDSGSYGIAAVTIPSACKAVLGGWLGLAVSVSDEDNQRHRSQVIKGGLLGLASGAILTGAGYLMGYGLGSLSK